MPYGLGSTTKLPPLDKEVAADLVNCVQPPSPARRQAGTLTRWRRLHSQGIATRSDGRSAAVVRQGTAQASTSVGRARRKTRLHRRPPELAQDPKTEDCDWCQPAPNESEHRVLCAQGER